MMRHLHTLLICLMLAAAARGQEQFSDGLTGADIDAAGTFSLEDQYYQCRVSGGACPFDFVLDSTKLYTRLYFDESAGHFYGSGWTLTVDYDIDLFTTGSTAAVRTERNQQLTINYHPADPYTDIDVAVFTPATPGQEPYTKAAVRINRVTSSLPGAIPDDIHFELHLDVERVYTLDMQASPRMAPAGVLDTARNTYTVYWDFLPGAEEYDLEWLLVDIANKPLNAPLEVDFRNATRITTQQHFYEISMAYPMGYLIYRVRGVGRAQRSSAVPVYDRRVEGRWSIPGNGGLFRLDGAVLKRLGGSTPADIETFDFWPGLESGRNWQYNVVYAEEGKRKEVINFYNGILKPTQSATLLNTDQTAVVSEPVYDFIGRNSLQVLPAPQESRGVRHYEPLHKTPAGTPYGYEAFDLDTNFAAPTPLSATGNRGAGHYYSSQNTNPPGINGAYTPDAEGYPFVRTLYKNDGSGRAARVSGVGKEYFDAAGGALQHATRYLYGSPFQEELFRLFGNNVGFAQYYEKTVTVDANGQASTAITDLAGRVVATALAGEAPENLYAIDTKPAAFDTLEVDLARLNEVDEQAEALLINKVLLAAGPTTFRFEYDIDTSLFTHCGVEHPCVYDLEIYLLDEYGTRVRFSYPGNPDVLAFSAISPSNLSAFPLRFSAAVDAGSYQLVKKLTLNEDFLDRAVADWKANQDCFEPDAVPLITSCNTDCGTLCEESYLTPEDVDGNRYYVTDHGFRAARLQGGTVVETYDSDTLAMIKQAIADCVTGCEDFDAMPDPCDIMYETLLADVSPGGQYFDNLPQVYLSDGTTLNPSYDRNGWLINMADYFRNSLTEDQLKCWNRLTGDFGHPGKSDYWEALRANWHPDMAHFLVQLHPEWCAFETHCGPREVSCTCVDADCTAWEVTVTAPAYDPLSPDDHRRIDGYISAMRARGTFRDGEAAARHALGGITGVDSALAANFTAAELEARARAYFEEAIIYCKVRENCGDRLPLQPDGPLSAVTADGFTIRYPEMDLYDCVCSIYPEDDPERFLEALASCTTALTDDACEEVARMAADRFVGRVKAQCDLLTEAQEKELWELVYREALADCEDPDREVETMDVIRDFAECNGLPEPCILDALPDDDEPGTSCECANINQFVYDIIRETPDGLISVGGVTRAKTFAEILTEPGIENHPAIQDALALALDSADLPLAANFPAWFRACQENPYTWNGTNPAPPARLAAFFACDDPVDDTDDDYDADADCAARINEQMQAQAEAAFQALLEEKAAEYRQAYIAHCLRSAAAGRERFDLQYQYQEYHYTLYYYDQAGNLVATVPPEGLYQQDPLTGTVRHNSLITDPAALADAWDYLTDPDAHPFVHTEHQLITNYQHNSLQNVVIQHTPDGGKTDFWHDALGRIAVSQNAEQATDNRYSFLQYDPLGRTVEAGEIRSALLMNATIAEDTTNFNIPGGGNALLAWIAGGTRRETTRTFYDTVDPALVPATHSAHGQQQHLRNRISAVAVDENGDGNYEALTHYTYDALGNVSTLWQENRAIPLPEHRVKRMDYAYDLVSGNVNQVTYQPGAADQFIHRYAYDADNRITTVRTSADGLIWDTDARYFYYAHGPLAREEIGDKHVFGNDFVYTIQGWMAGTNSSVLDPDRDAGKDGASAGLNRHFGRDPMAFSLHYFNNQYKPVAASASDVLATRFGAINQAGPIATAATKPLYNGNISMMVTSLKDLAKNPLPAMANTYKYDQLNRIKSFTPFWDAAGNDPLHSNTFDSVRNEGNGRDGYYNSRYWFDGNGNIARLQRNGTRTDTDDFTRMDDMAYGYDTTPTGVKTNNRLSYVDDRVSTPGFALDIESGQTAGNYQYDAIGRLTKDRQEKIDSIRWNTGNKVTEVVQSDTDPDVAFGYGPLGNRITKWVKAKSGTARDTTRDTRTFYVLDTEGNPMAVYQWADATGTFRLQDFNLYGNKRLGTRNRDMELTSGSWVAPDTLTRLLGGKNYELSNHLGNVMAVTTDRKLQVRDTGSAALAYHETDMVQYNDYYPYGMRMPERSFDNGEYKYGFNGQQNTDDITRNRNHYTAAFWEYSPRVVLRWQLDPKPVTSISPYVINQGNPILLSDPLGDTVKYGGFMDRLNTFFAKTFNKNFRKKVQEWDTSEDTYILSKNKKADNRLVNADPEILENDANNSDYSTYNVRYNKGFGIQDISNNGLRKTIVGVSVPFQLSWNIGKLALGAPIGIGVAIANKVFGADIGWGMAGFTWIAGTDANVFSFGIGDWGNYNMFFQKRKSGSRGYGFNGLVGVRVGIGKKKNVVFFDVGTNLVNRRRKYFLHFNFFRRKGKNRNKRAQIDTRYESWIDVTTTKQ